VTLERFDFHVRDLVLAERGFVQERLVARIARKVPGPVVISAVDVQAHGRLERSAAHLAHCLVVQLVPEPDVIVQLILVFELGQAQVAVQMHGGPLWVLVELQVERVPHLGRERLAALRALRRLDLIARVPQHVDLALEPSQAHPAPVHRRVAERLLWTVDFHQVIDGRVDGLESGDAAQRTLGGGRDAVS